MSENVNQYVRQFPLYVYLHIYVSCVSLQMSKTFWVSGFSPYTYFQHIESLIHRPVGHQFDNEFFCRLYILVYTFPLTV